MMVREKGSTHTDGCLLGSVTHEGRYWLDSLGVSMLNRMWTPNSFMAVLHVVSLDNHPRKKKKKKTPQQRDSPPSVQPAMAKAKSVHAIPQSSTQPQFYPSWFGFALGETLACDQVGDHDEGSLLSLMVLERSDYATSGRVES